MEASALQAPRFARISLPSTLLRLRSDEQLLALFRAGSDDAFGVLHDRYRQRLFAYVRQMLSQGSRQDAEDVLQDVFVRAFRALRADEREVCVRAWLYRVAHNRCIDHLRRPIPPPAEVFELSRKPLQDPLEETQRREHLAQIVRDVSRLPDQQRSALLMREIDGLSYADLAGALETSVPAVKSLLVRARVGLVEAADARDADCEEIRTDLAGAYDRGVKASGRARRHLRECAPCRDYRTALRGAQRSLAAFSPPFFAGPLAVLAKLGLGGAGGGVVAGGTAAAGGGATVGAGAVATGGSLAGMTACKVAAVVCGAALTAGGAAEVSDIVRDAAPAPPSRVAASAAAMATSAAARGTDEVAPARVTVPALELRRDLLVSDTVGPRADRDAKDDGKAEPLASTEPAELLPADEPGAKADPGVDPLLAPLEEPSAPAVAPTASDRAGGVEAPADAPVAALGITEGDGVPSAADAPVAELVPGRGPAAVVPSAEPPAPVAQLDAVRPVAPPAPPVGGAGGVQAPGG